jgi:uncharacterized protein (TIGR03435 family)
MICGAIRDLSVAGHHERCRLYDNRFGAADGNSVLEVKVNRLVTAALVVALGSASSAQTQFEVASVKKVTNNEGILTIDFAPERLEILMSLRDIIVVAYDLRDFQVSGGPRWIYSDTYQILAKAPGKASPAEMRVMLQSLLAERFQLKIHRETKTAPSYELVLARNDGRLGPELRKSEIDCAALGPNPPPVAPTSKAWCGLRGTGPLRITGQGAEMARLAGLLTSAAGRLVTDETGLPGGYDFQFLWSDNPTADSPPSLGTALSEQLGLKLVPSERPIEYLVIDEVQPAAPD